MTLRRRVTLLVAALLLASAAAIGVVSAELARRTGLRELDASLQATIDAIAPADDPTSALFERVDALDQPLAAELFFDDADPVPLVEAFDGESPLDLAGVADESIVAAESRAIAVDGALRIRAVSLGDGQWLVVGVSARAVEDQWADTVRLALAAAVASETGRNARPTTRPATAASPRGGSTSRCPRAGRARSASSPTRCAGWWRRCARRPSRTRRRRRGCATSSATCRTSCAPRSPS